MVTGDMRGVSLTKVRGLSPLTYFHWVLRGLSPLTYKIAFFPFYLYTERHGGKQ